MVERAEMTEYREMAENALRASRATGSRHVVSNRGPEHARAVIDVLVTSADRTMSFVCGYLSSEIFDAAKIREFLDGPDTHLAVLLDRAPDPVHGTALTDLVDLMAGDDPKLRVRRLDHRVKVHFAVADDRDVRIETDVESRKAVVVFGDQAVALSAAQKFKTLWDAASPVYARDIPARA